MSRLLNLITIWILSIVLGISAVHLDQQNFDDCKSFCTLTENYMVQWNKHMIGQRNLPSPNDGSIPYFTIKFPALNCDEFCGQADIENEYQTENRIHHHPSSPPLLSHTVKPSSVAIPPEHHDWSKVFDNDVNDTDLDDEKTVKKENSNLHAQLAGGTLKSLMNLMSFAHFLGFNDKSSNDAIDSGDK
ncbi:uncharacterized protein LOC141855270 [Brevipalpus obovatus]|uniref:uncharacterized protein LOC141855270 n=1 Tax=Brevipalpus obovatus TaxID=246614 RepID=UPI003D9EFF42